MTDFKRHIRAGLLALLAGGLLSGCHATPGRDMAHLPPSAQDYLLVTSYFMAEGGLVSRLQDGGLSGQQVYDMATSLKYGKHMLLEALSHPSHAARRRGQQAIEIMLACTNQVDPSTLGGGTPARCLPGVPLFGSGGSAPGASASGASAPNANGQVPPQPDGPAHR
ncbi:hypothetical protein [Komagataeibacter rhaeticus]|uniref:Uncharacterized protein n=1 Tax=Komagataeibacter rhaeticus TaxID=215221 RepID=A0A181C8N0_9PROT|nr:hypothetical protein [Komagataeibacter rhaeticus]ATU73369.1 hypothetical protein CT154_11630 [Komagataeibacter xylinus]QIP34803.1 hypothetical protein GWK63_04240 [Komagataeibacter rhaeticus]QOC47332.1 hypothetical protein ICJ78_04240 [Komagataeibacter rhaeticus]WPP23269.1 hypothetical protein SCD25_07395 [Komagataeibacter rhaeticus]SAY47893.1 hypothetical protein KRIGEM_00838 [Komagataeibacter rhaeticus]